MCFHLKNDNDKKRIAKKNITCYKVLGVSDRGNLISEHRSFRYKPGILYKSRIGKPHYSSGFCYYFIDRGRHSYSNYIEAKKNCGYYQIIYMCIIPKGSEYYYNPDDCEYVSNQIIVKKRKHK